MTPEGKVMACRMKLRSKTPYVGSQLIYMQPVYTDEVETMGVDMGNKLYISLTWVAKLTLENVMAVTVHELLHKLLMHPFRRPPDVLAASKRGRMTPELRWKHHMHNVACDLKVNYMLHDIGLFSALPDTDLKPDRYGTWSTRIGGKVRYLRDIPGKSVERLYRELLDMYEEEGKPHVEWKLLDCHNNWSNCTQEMSEEEQKALAGAQLVRIAGLLNQGKGDIPDSLARELKLLMTPVIGWKGKLQRFVEPIVATELSYRRPRRSSWAIGVVLPGRTGEGVHLIVHIDTSGSMDDPELEQILAEQYGILDSYPHVRITLLHSGSGKPKVIELRETDRDNIQSMINLKDGGGTSHRPVVDWVLENRDEECRALICFTDGDSDIQRCFNDLQGDLFRMLVLTRERNIENLSAFCEETTYLPVSG